MSFTTIMEKYRAYASSTTHQGERFERLIQAFLLTDPTYADLFQTVWLWSQFPGRKSLGGTDTGIDLVALTHDNQYWAIQCKFVQAHTPLNKQALDAFLATSSRRFQDDQGQTHHFAQRLWISTSAKPWTNHAINAIHNQNPPINRISLTHLQEAPVDWDKMDAGIFGTAARTIPKIPKLHQQQVLDSAYTHYLEHARGKLIMACGTGKTLTALWLAEQQTAGQGLVLFLVPSIALLGQTLREWLANSTYPIHPICICSDPKVNKTLRDNDTILDSTADLPLPASTDVPSIIKQLERVQDKPGITVVFSTYQSIDIIAQAHLKPFDLIICDEAHRTTGFKFTDTQESNFVKVHDDSFIQASKRLYMTATPRFYDDDSKAKAAQADSLIWSMDDESIYGPEIHRISFSQAVDQGLLTDYKVLVLTISDRDIPPSIQRMIADADSEISMDDMPKLIGCINALSKQVLGDQGTLKASDPDPMRRAVAFCANIKASQKITRIFNDTTDTYIDALPIEQRQHTVQVSADHIDGSMDASMRETLMTWLKEEPAPGECRILTNVRCLSEGVDVPALDAVLFLSPRNSKIEVVQSVGRVMRIAPGKKYGYIIIPIVVPSDIEPEQALNDNKRFSVVWEVLQALRAHDERLRYTIDKVLLNKHRPENINVVGAALSAWIHSDQDQDMPSASFDKANRQLGHQLQLQFEQLQSAIFARMVQKVGNRRPFEMWAKEVAQIAEIQMGRIKNLIDKDTTHQAAFDNFLKGLQRNINPSISKQEAIEMLSQHIITRPVFEALFEGYSFVENNPISQAMQTMLNLLEAQAFEKDTLVLDKFYNSVRSSVKGIDNAPAKQRIITELYDKFFKTAFPKMVEKLGIVYTPIEVVDFIIHSVQHILDQEFGRSLADENVHILDPFTGTGTFITRLLQSGLIPKESLSHKYKYEIHANEIVLLAYYIAAVNIENTYHDLIGQTQYSPFQGICLTDTFQLGEQDSSTALFKDVFPQNSERVKNQKKAPLRVIIGNPPYSAGQKSANDNAKNQNYSNLKARIEATYTREASATNNTSTYNSYIRALRWSSDRLDPINGGIICFVSNGGWIDDKAQQGLRKCFEREFSTIYVFNLRGDANLSGELRRKEADNVFGIGSRSPIAITLLVKKPISLNSRAQIHYYDIGDYLNRKDKLDILSKFCSVGNTSINWSLLEPNEYGDWINLRSESFERFIPIGDKKGASSHTYFASIYSRGLASARDSWCYNSSKPSLEQNISLTINFFNEQRLAYQTAKHNDPNQKVADFVSYDSKLISWNRAFLQFVEKDKKIKFSSQAITIASYRPFFKQNIYFAREMNDMVYQLPKLFPNPTLPNQVICVSGGSNGLGLLITDAIPDLHLNGDAQCFPLYYYEERPKSQLDLFQQAPETTYTRHDAITDWIHTQAIQCYGAIVTKEDIFYYVYGFLHHPDYQTTFANDLKKMLPRLPLVEHPRDFWKFSKAGRALADLHLHYETVPPCPQVKVVGVESGYFKVEKMRFIKKGQKDTIIYNSTIRIENIPARAYDYNINGKSAIEWIMERYAITTHKESGIRNDPNDWATEVGNPRYILDLLLSIIQLSLQTLDIIHDISQIQNWLPKEPQSNS